MSEPPSLNGEETGMYIQTVHDTTVHDMLSSV